MGLIPSSVRIWSSLCYLSLCSEPASATLCLHKYTPSKSPICVSLWSIEVSIIRVTLTDQCPTYVSLWPISVQHISHLNHDRPCRSCGVSLPASYYQGFSSITGTTIWDLYRTSWDTILFEFLGFPCHYLLAKAPYSFISHPCVGKSDRKTPQYYSVSHRITKITKNKTKVSPSFVPRCLNVEVTSRQLLSGICVRVCRGCPQGGVTVSGTQARCIGLIN
jgi:hypothetical protein